MLALQPQTENRTPTASFEGLTVMSRTLRFLLFVLLTFLGACDEKESPPPSEDVVSQKPQLDAEGRCEHGLPPALCTKCNPSLVPVFQAKGDYCEKHGFAQSFCPICSPDAEIPDVGASDPPADWCGAHGLPESKCNKCNPKLEEKFKEAGDWCAEHGFPESV